MRLTTAFLALGLVVGGPALADKVSFLPIAGDGSIAGVPAEYGPARLQVDFSALGSNEPAVSSVTLSLGDKKTHLPSCVTGLLHSLDLKDVTATGSWYHHESGLPYYINFMFQDADQNAENPAAAGFSFLFNLRTGKLIAMVVHIPRDHGQSVQYVPVDMAARCPAGTLEAIKDSTGSNRLWPDNSARYLLPTPRR